MKYIALLFSAFILAGCSLVVDPLCDLKLGSDFSDIELYYGDFSEITEPDQIPYWMTNRINYEVTEEIKSPREVLESGICDCDGYAILYMNIMYVRFGVKTSLCAVKDTREIIDGGTVNHAIVRFGDKYIRAQIGTEYTGKIGYEYSFDHVFKY